MWPVENHSLGWGYAHEITAMESISNIMQFRTMFAVQPPTVEL